MSTKNLKINKCWLFISVDGDGNEGLVAHKIGGTWMPMVAADSIRVESLKPIVEMMVKETKVKVKLIEFSTRKEIEEYT